MTAVGAMGSSRMLVLLLLLQLGVSSISSRTIPDYIHVCKRDQTTIDDCVLENVRSLKGRLITGIPELKVPPIEPLNIPEIVIDQGNVVRFKAIGKDVKMRGASDHEIKSISVDLEDLIIKVRVFFPHLSFDGKYDLDARLLVPIHGRGNINIEAVNCDADLVLYAKLENKNGKDYLRFNDVRADINVDDYTLSLTNLFNGDQQLGGLMNQILNQNKAPYFLAAKPYIERTVSNIVKKIANRITGSFSFDDILPVA